MPTTNRDASGRFVSITSNPVRLSTTNFIITENTTMPTTTFAPTPAFASILSGIETRVSAQATALVETRVSTMVHATVADHVRDNVEGILVAMNIPSLLRAETTTVAREAAAAFIRAEVPVIRDSVVEQVITGFSLDTSNVAYSVAERMVQDHNAAVLTATVDRLMSEYFYDGSTRVDRVERAVVERLTDRLCVEMTTESISNRVADKLAALFAAHVAQQLFGIGTVTAAVTASTAPERA